MCAQQPVLQQPWKVKRFFSPLKIFFPTIYRGKLETLRVFVQRAKFARDRGRYFVKTGVSLKYFSILLLVSSNISENIETLETRTGNSFRFSFRNNSTGNFARKFNPLNHSFSNEFRKRDTSFQQAKESKTRRNRIPACRARYAIKQRTNTSESIRSRFADTCATNPTRLMIVFARDALVVH